MTPDCPDLDKDKLVEREKELLEEREKKLAEAESFFFQKIFRKIQLWSTSLFDSSSFQKTQESFQETQEWLRFRKDDPRDKLLVAITSADWNGGFDPKYSYQIFVSSQKPLVKHNASSKLKFLFCL